MRVPQEIVEDIIDCLSGDPPALATCALVSRTWVARSRHHLFHTVTFNKTKAEQWSSIIRPGPDGTSCLVRTLKLQQAPGHQWLDANFLDEISDHLSSFRRVETLFITWLDLSAFEPGSLAGHFAHFGSSLRSLRLSYLSADFSVLITFLHLFPDLEDLLIHTPDLYDDDHPRPHILRSAPPFHGSLNLLSLDLASSPFVAHLAGLDLRFSSISAFDCEFLSGFPLNHLLEASSLSLRHLQLEYITFSECANVSLIRCEHLQEVIVGVFEEGRPPSLLLSLLSTLSSYRITRVVVDFVAIPSPHWSEWKVVDAHLLQMTERCGLKQGPDVVLRTRLGIPSDAVDGRQLLPDYWDVGLVEMRFNCRNARGS